MAAREEARRRLEEERARLAAEVERAAEEPDEYVGQEFSYYGNHLADVGTDTFEEEKAQALEAHLRGLLGQVDAALERLKNGTYGICENCGKEIAPERLEALPYATLCLDCASGRRARAARA
jgi:RNA polymerase-binding protein DksA